MHRYCEALREHHPCNHGGKMNNAYIVTYDLSAPGRNYEEVHKAIKGHSGWAMLGGSAYVVLTDKSVVEVRDAIAAKLDSNDKLFVGVINAPAAWIGLTDEVSDWLKNNLK